MTPAGNFIPNIASGVAAGGPLALTPFVNPRYARVAGWNAGLIGGPAALSSAAAAPWWMPGRLGAGGLLAAGGLGFAGGSLLGGLTGSSTGGGIGGALGAILGGLTPFGPVGAAVGGLAGSLLGGAFGGLFGGGPQSNKVAFGPGNLGSIRGTGAGSQFITGLDEQLMDILNARQEAIVNQALAFAPSIPVQFSREPSWNDLSNMARSRIAPAAASLGLNPDLIAGQRQQFSAEQQVQNFQTALQIMKDIEALRIGPIGTAFRDLNERFEELWSEANRLGVATHGLAEAQARAFRILSQETRIQTLEVLGAAGAWDDFSVAAHKLDAEMNILSARAQELGMNLDAAITQEHIRRWQQLSQEFRLQQLEVLGASGAWDSMSVALHQLDAQMQLLSVRARDLGLNLDASIAVEHQRQAQELIQQERIRRHGLLETIGLTNTLGRALADLDAEMRLAWIEADRLGYSTANLTRQHHLAAQELIQQDRLRRHASLEVVGIFSPLQRALADLDAQMELARVEAERLGYSTAGVAAEQQRLAQAIIRQHQAQIDALALSITQPFEQLLTPLREFGKGLEFQLLNPLQQSQRAGEDFRAIAQRALGGDIIAIQQFQEAGQRFIEEAARVGASPAQAAAIQEVLSFQQQLQDVIVNAQREATSGLEDAIREAEQRNQDKLSEVVAELRLVGEEIRRLRRS
jgi:hypothetical protein